MRKTLLVLAVALKYVLFTPLACGAPKVIAVPFTSTPNGQVVVSVLINGQAHNLELDSGASVTAIDMTAYGNGAIQSGGQATGAGGAQMSVNVGSINLKIGNKSIDLDVYVFPKGQHVCSDGKNEGLLGEDVLRKLASVTIDYAHKQVVFTEK